jgi:eukaryotic-like serine/threonine-protein kinase
MVAGRTPFTGETPTDVIAAIVKTPPQPLMRLAPEAPPKLEEIVSKALEKDREDRYQGIRDLLVDLRRLKKRLDFETELERSATPEGSAAPAVSTISGHQPTVTSAAETVTLTADQATRPTTSAEFIATEIKRHKKGVVVILVALALTVASLAFGLYKFREKKPPPFQTIKISNLTNIGNATGAVISPNGEYVAHVVYEGGKNSLRVWDVATKSSVEIVPPAEDRLLLFVHAFSPDSRYIYYGKQPGNLYQIAVLGGTPKKILEKVNSGITFSPDGKRFAFVRGGRAMRYLGSPLDADTENSLVIANADGTGEQILAKRKGGEMFGTAGPDWSPDGKTLACGVYTDGTNMTVAAVPVEGGTVKPVTSQNWLGVWRVVWVRDGSGLVFSADDQTHTQLWYVSYPEGNAHRITNDVNTYGRGSFSMTADSGTIGTIKVEFISNIFVVPAEDPGHARQIARGVGNPHRAFGIAWTPDGKIVYSTTMSGNADIWIMNADGTGNRQLTNDPGLDVDPKVSPDGRYVVFVSTRSGRNNIWRMDADGSHPKQLSNGGNDGVPSFSHDGKWVIYSSVTTSDLRKVPIDGGISVQLTDRPVTWPTVSLTEGMIAGLYRSDENSPQRLAVFTPEGGRPIKTFDIPSGLFSYPRWTSNGRSILYVITRAETSSLWSQPVDGGAPKQLTDFKPEQIFSLDLSRDGKWLVFTRGTILRDVILITDTGKQ